MVVLHDDGGIAAHRLANQHPLPQLVGGRAHVSNEVADVCELVRTMPRGKVSPA